ncbi:MAG: hypothetical protein MJ159_04600 [Treponemataceae bacterium]|nr:hypothetical protein [Treponemataceae bacterium]
MIWTFLITTVLYIIVELYEVYYDSIMFEIKLSTSRTQRMIGRNIIGVLLIGIDLLLFFWAKDFQPKEYNKMIITYASCILMLLHVLGSFFAMFRLKKGYIAVDIIKFFVMLISAGTMAILIHFFNIGKGLLFLIAILAILCTRATRMLNGNWLELLLDDLDEDDY